MKIKQELFYRLNFQTNAGTNILAMTDVCPPGEVWLVNVLGLTNNSGEAQTATPVIVQTYQNLPFSADLAIPSAKGGAVFPVIHIGPGEAIGFLTHGAANKSPVTLIVTGWKYYLDETPGIPNPPESK